MIRKLSFLALLAAWLAAPASAGTITGAQTTTAGQDTYIQQTLIPAWNTAKCARFGLASSCTTANLASAGCTSQAFTSVTKSNLVYLDCTIYTLDATGENNFAADLLATILVDIVRQNLNADIAARCTAWKLMTRAQKDAALAAMTPAQPAGSEMCQ
jgi:hypothetical protein